MTLSLPRFAVVAALAGALACGPSAANAPEYRADRISEVELERTSATTAYEAVQRLRPDWLKKRGRGSFSRSEPIQVYVDDHHAGTLGALGQLPIGHVRSMQFLDGILATQRFGTNHGAGAILVFSR